MKLGVFRSSTFICLFFLLAVGRCFGASGDVNVSANVSSLVSKQLSNVSISSSSTLADLAGHSILVSVTLIDANKQPLANKLVELSSTRGSTDIIEATSKLISLQAKSEAEPNYFDMRRDYSDNNGLVTFRLTSFVPGQAEIKVLADSSVELSLIKTNFDPLPISMGMTVVAKFPSLNKELTLLSSDYNRDNLTDLQKSALGNTTPGAKIYLPGWVFILICLGFLLLIVLMVVVTINRVMIGGIKEEELDILKKISKSNDIESLKKDVAES